MTAKEIIQLAIDIAVGVATIALIGVRTVILAKYLMAEYEAKYGQPFRRNPRRIRDNADKASKSKNASSSSHRKPKVDRDDEAHGG